MSLWPKIFPSEKSLVKISLRYPLFDTFKPQFISQMSDELKNDQNLWDMGTICWTIFQSLKPKLFHSIIILIPSFHTIICDKSKPSFTKTASTNTNWPHCPTQILAS